MAHKIVWTKTAEKEFDNILSYLESEWNESICRKFINRVDDIFDLLTLYPEAGTIEVREENIRGFLISKQVRLFYRIKSKNIVLMNFFDTRLNPKKRLKRYK